LFQSMGPLLQVVDLKGKLHIVVIYYRPFLAYTHSLKIKRRVATLFTVLQHRVLCYINFHNKEKKKKNIFPLQIYAA